MIVAGVGGGGEQLSLVSIQAITIVIVLDQG